MNYNNLLFFNKKGHQQNLTWNGNFWEGRILMPQVSVDLFEMEHIFGVEKLLNPFNEIKYGIPHASLPETYGNPDGITASFTNGSDEIILSAEISSELIGAYIFSPYIIGGQILSINGTKVKLNSVSTGSGNSSFSISAIRVRFETPYNIVDFDEIPSIIVSYKSGTNIITTNSDITLVKSGYLIAGEGIPNGTKIIAVNGKNIEINKILEGNINDSNCWIYKIEDSNDVSERIYQYNLIDDPLLDSPVIVNVTNKYIPLDWNNTDTIFNGLTKTDLINSDSLSINIALNSDQEGFIGRSLIIEDISKPVPSIILRLEIVGEVIGEDERFNYLLENFGEGFYKEDAGILRDSDPNEPYPDYLLINNKRKELLIQGSEIFPYLGSYKGLINIIKFFGYQDLRIKEYWLNIQKSSLNSMTPLQVNQGILDSMKNTPTGKSILINDLHDDANSGKFKQVEIYGKKSDGTYGLKSSIEKIFPSSTYKKTPLFGLFYDINEIVPNEEDQWGYPITKDSFLFSPEEILIKLFALKEKLKKDYLPVSAKIIDITGEGFYFSLNKTRGWVDTLKIDEINLGLDISISVSPKIGYIEDLRAFQTRNPSIFPSLPFIPGYEGNLEKSDFGNLIDVDPFNQNYSPAEASLLSDAIINYYDNLKNNGGKLDLGDGDYNGIGYKKYSDKKDYYLPAGFPSVLETTSFNLTMDDIGSPWNNLDKNIATYSTIISSISNLTDYDGNAVIDSSLNQTIKIDSPFFSIIDLSLPTGLEDYLIPVDGSYINPGKVQLKISYDILNYIVVEVQSYDSGTGEASTRLLYYKGNGTYNNWEVKLTNLFEEQLSVEYYNYSFGSNGSYSWDNLRFLGYYEIEWTISKDGDNPYFFQMRGNIKDYYRLPHIFPYHGKYDIKCRVWNSFNDVSIGYFNSFVEVEPRNIELTSITRFREAEEYTWDSMVKTWNDYDSPWIFPVEQQPDQQQPSQIIMRPAYYGNNFNDGQECRVLKSFDEVKSKLEFNIGVISHQIISISSNYGAGITPAVITTSTEHNLNAGDRVYIKDLSVSPISGEYLVENIISPNSFSIPLIIQSDITTAGNYITGPGNLKIYYDNRLYLNIDYSGDIGDLSARIYSSINGLNLDPHYTIKEYSSTNVIGISDDIFLYKISMESPIGTGSKYNGKSINIQSIGSLILNPSGITLSNNISPIFSGGSNSYNDYINYTPGDDLPTYEMKNWGTKKIDWDSLNDISWNDLYSQTLPMLDYHQDWLGGFDLYNIRYGDQIKIGKNNQGTVIGVNGSPSEPMFLYDVAKQLNESNDPGVSKFTYTVRGYSRIYGQYDTNGYNSVEDVIAPHITYSQSSLYTSNAPADFNGMTNGLFAETLQTGTYDSSLEWVQMDLHQATHVTKVIVGCDFNNTLLGDWGKTYTENKDVEYSLDGITWSLLFNTGLFTQGIQEYLVDITTRYIRITSSSWLSVTEFYAMVPFFTEIGPINESTKTYNDLGFTPSSICKGLNGEIYMADGTNIHIFKSPTDIETIQLDYSGIYLQVDRKNRIWYYGDSSVPLQIIDIKHPDKKIAFISSTSSPSGYYKDIIIPVSFLTASIDTLAIDDRKEDFSITITYNSIKKLMYYDGGKQEFELYDTSDGIPSMNIRQMVFDYSNKNKTLWIATDSGISVYDRIKFFNYRTTNSGLFSNNIYSICIDESNNKWIGTDQGITYYDGEIWGVWNNSNTPSLPTGVDYTNILNAGHGNIFFIFRDTLNNYNLGYFNGDNFIIYTNDPGTNDTFIPYTNPTSHYENHWILLMDIKTIDQNYYQCPGNIFYLGSTQNLKQFDYTIPHIHACSKYSGSEGWDFVYYSSSRSLPSVQTLPIGIGYSIIDFNFITGSINSNYILSDLFRPKLPLVDRYTWKIPDWTGYDFNGVTNNHPELNPDHLFLDAPLRDILNESALKEEYWRNSPIERIADKKERDLISDFDWLVRLGDSEDDRGMKVIVGNDGYIYVTGFYKDNVYFGAPNNLNSGALTTLSSPNCQSIFVSKYNSSGIIQWVRSYGQDNGSSAPYDYDFTPTSIKLDSLGNCYVVGYKFKNRNNISGELPSNILIKWDWNGVLISGTQLFTPSSDTAFDENFDVVVDDVNNLYIAGEFTGTLSSGEFTITTDTPYSKEIYVAKIEYDGYITYLNKLNTGNQEYNPSLALGKYNDLYIGFSNYNMDNSQVKLRSYNSLDFSIRWEKNINVIGSPVIINPSLDLSSDGEILISFPHSNEIEIENVLLQSAQSVDIALFKFLTTGNLVWGKNIGSTYGDYVHSIKTDKEGRIYLLSSYAGAFFLESPVHVESPNGDLDILLIKLEKNGDIIDLVSVGSLNKDEGMDICLDKEQNLYLTGYLSGSINTGKYVTSPTIGNSKDIFIGKIAHKSFIPGKSIGGITSWFGTQTWGNSEKRIHNKEFEIPIGSTVFMNPHDSNIPGKKLYKWKLTERSTGLILADIKDPSYFIWNFKTPGFYDIELEIQDSNGNMYTFLKEGYIRVVNHKDKFLGETVPHKITSKDFIDQALYPY